MTQRVKVKGLKELEKALGELPKSTGKSVLRRILKKAGKPLAEDMRAKAPDDPSTSGDDLKSSIAVSTKLSPRQRRLHRRMFKNDKASAEMFVGPGPDPAAWNQEFGNVNHGPQSFARPAWDANKRQVLKIIEDDLGEEITKAAERLARKQARLAGKG